LEGSNGTLSCFVCKRNYIVVDSMIVVFSPHVVLNVIVVVLVVNNCELSMLHRSISLSLATMYVTIRLFIVVTFFFIHMSLSSSLFAQLLFHP
jgi:hypothetical protein